MRRPRSAFSLIELMVVLGTIGILLGLLLPAVQQARGSAARLSCLNNLKQIGLALHHFHDVHGQFPPLPISPRPVDPGTRLCWMVSILPQMEQGALYQISVQASQLDPIVFHNPPHIGLATVVRPYLCPADGRFDTPRTDPYGYTAAYTSYLGIDGSLAPGARLGHSGIFEEESGARLAQVTDGASQTLMVGERPPPDSLQAGWWYPGLHYWGAEEGFRGPNNSINLGASKVVYDDPCIVEKGTFGPGRTDNPCDRYHLWSLHTGGANFLFADASARFLPYSAEPLMIALGSRDGGEVVDLP